ncbi:MAG: YdcF family protein [Bacteroidota bacterium]
MFFTLSKLLSFVITPMVWIITLLFFSFFIKNEKLKRKCLTWALVFSLLFSNAFLFDECIRSWEIPATHYKDLKTYDAGIVLGGLMTYDQNFDRLQFQRGADRLLQAIELYKLGIIKKIIFTGGSGSILHPDEKEGIYAKRYLLTLGIPEQDFFIESESRNTHENAVLTKKLIDKENIKGNFLLITSAFHMRRSLGCFNKAGITATHYSTDRYSGPRKLEFDHLIIPNFSAMDAWNNLIREIVGFITYKIMGYA